MEMKFCINMVHLSDSDRGFFHSLICLLAFSLLMDFYTNSLYLPYPSTSLCL
jgi:hypothetical protein